jgi:hypothetical protein
MRINTMKNFFTRTVAAVGLALSMLAVVALSTPVFAQPSPISPRSYVPRTFNTQQTAYLRFTVAFNSCAPAGNCTAKVGTLPYNAFLLRVYYQGETAFGSTTNLISLGTTATTAVNIMAAVTGFQALVAPVQGTIVAGNLGVVLTGNTIAQTGAEGGFDVYATMTFTGSAPTAGLAAFVLEYASPNDGTCTAVPLAATAVGC